MERGILGKVHLVLSKLHGVSLTDHQWATEGEYKITSGGRLLSKQARP